MIAILVGMLTALFIVFIGLAVGVYVDTVLGILVSFCGIIYFIKYAIYSREI